MIPPVPIILTIMRGTECVYKEEGIYDIWVGARDDKLVAAIRNISEDKTIFEEPVPFGFLTMSAPFVTVWLKKA